MIVKFFRFGKGNSKPCLDYLLGKDRDREHARVLSGDVDLTAALIDSSRFTKKYTSGCLSFAEADLPEDAKQKIMADFEQCLFPGMSPDQYNITWIEHRDKGRLELNFVIPNTELSTGKRLQPFYAPADINRVDEFKQIINHDYNLHSPDDPENKQLARVNIKTDENDEVALDDQGEPIIEPKKAKIGQSLKADEVIKDIDTKLMKAYLKGHIQDRNDAILFITDQLGYNVSRIVNKSISISLPDRKRPIRLTGEMYERGFKVQESDPQAEERRTESYRSQISARIGGLRERYENRIAAKAENLAERYRSVEPDHLSSCGISAAATIRADQSIQQLYSVAINDDKSNAWRIDSTFSGYGFGAVFLQWASNEPSQSKRKSSESPTATAFEQPQSTKIEIENAARRRIIELGRETVTLYQAMSPHNDIAKSNHRELAAQSEHTRTNLQFNSEATARAISDANASYERFRRNLNFGNTDAAALRKVFESEEIKQKPKQSVVTQSLENDVKPVEKVENTSSYEGPSYP